MASFDSALKVAYSSPATPGASTSLIYPNALGVWCTKGPGGTEVPLATATAMGAIQESSVGGTYNPTSAASGVTPVGVADFVWTAHSTRMRVDMGMYLLSKNAGASASVHARTRTGSTLRAGTILRDDVNLDGIANYNTAYIKGWVSTVLDGLTIGNSYNTHPVCSHAGTLGAAFTLGVVKVYPV